MPRARIRKATERDLDVLVLHRRKMWEDLEFTDEDDLDAHDRTYRRWARQRMRTGRLVGFVAEVSGHVVASGCVWLRPAQPFPGRTQTLFPYVLSMYTERGHRKKGLAARLVRETTRWSRTQGYGRLTLHAATKARPLYRRLGFQRSWEMRVRLRPRRRP